MSRYRRGVNQNYYDRIVYLEARNENIVNTLMDIKLSINKLSTDLNGKIDKLDGRIDKLDAKIWNLFLWTNAGFAGVFGLMAKILHWI